LLRESEIVGVDFGSWKPTEDRPVENCKLRYFNPFEFFDHTGSGAGSGINPHPGCTPTDQRIAAGIQGGMNAYLGGNGILGSLIEEGVGGAAAPETAGGSLLLSIEGGYDFVSRGGQLVSGIGQLEFAASGRQSQSSIFAAGDVVSGPVLGLARLVQTGGNVESASKWASLESFMMTGKGLINSATVTKLLVNVVDFGMSVAGTVGNSTCNN
jgi:hypothetical protein